MTVGSSGTGTGEEQGDFLADVERKVAVEVGRDGRVENCEGVNELADVFGNPVGVAEEVEEHQDRVRGPAEYEGQNNDERHSQSTTFSFLQVVLPVPSEQ